MKFASSSSFFLMKNFLALILIILSISSHSQNWQVIWEDEFDGNSLDLTKWSHDLGTGSAQGLWGWGNGELQYYQPDNTSVGNGVLTIEAKEEPQGISDFYSGNVPYYYSSSKILTRDKFEFKYGKVEARMKTIDGQGYWPAFWMLPGEGCWPESGEIDIMEQWGNDGSTNVTTGASHMGNCGSSSNYIAWNESLSSGSYADAFHVYSVVWYEDYIGWYVDDVLISSVTPSSYPSDLNWPFNDNDWFMILNLAITNAGPNSNTVLPGSIEVDYVRVSQSNDIIGCTNSTASNYNPDATIDNDSCLFPLGFSVNMNCTSESFSTMYVTGPFANWCGDCFPLVDNNNDGIWTGTYDFPEGNVEYKYTYDNWTSQEDLIDDMQNGGACAPVTDYSSYANRLVAVPTFLSVSDSYGSCESCVLGILGCTNPIAANYNPSASIDDGSCVIYGCLDMNAANYNTQANSQIDPCEYEVMFSLDMRTVEFSFMTPEVNGSWDGWCGACHPMSDLDLDGVWEATVVLPEGFHEFKYAIDSWTDQEEFDGGESCTLTTGLFTNRFLTVTGPMNYGISCWESCDSCLNIGCTDPLYIEYDYLATIDDGTCSNFKVNGCTYSDALNYDVLANTDDLSCVFAVNAFCPGDFNSDGFVNVSDLGGFLGAFGSPCN